MKHPTELSIVELLEDCIVETTRSTGPGGQHRNKTDSAVVIKHVSGCRGQASEMRSQASNKAKAIFRLRMTLATQLRTEPNDQPSEQWTKWVRNGKLAISSKHDDFPAILADTLNAFHLSQYELAAAAIRLQISSAQIQKILRQHEPAMVQCNRERAARGLHPLRG